MKSFTDIEQSKVLAEILPLDSADYFYKYCIGHYNSIYYRLETYPYNKGGNKNHDIPCWSLAALLDILPLEVSFNKQTDGVDTYYYIASCDARYCDVYSHRHINVVDACYEMITILKEKNLI